MLKLTNLRIDSGKLKSDVRYHIIDSEKPIFSWSVMSDGSNAFQKSYKIKVWTETEILWETQFVDSKKQEAKYNGKLFESGTKIYFSLEIVDNIGNKSEKIEDYFYYGVADWKAQWIASKYDVDSKALYFRKIIDIDKPIKTACIYACGLGYHKLYVNGCEIDSSVMDPAHSDYTKKCYYVMIPEIEKYLSSSKNCISAIIGEGWRRNKGNYLNGRKVDFFGIPQFTAMIKIVYKDNSIEWVNTNSTWEYTYGAITQNNLFDGETYDANSSIKNWNLSTCESDSFSSASVVPSPGGEMNVQTLEPIKEKEIYNAQAVDNVKDNICVVDFGQNIAGVIRLTLPKKLEKGQKISISHMEFLDEDGLLYMANLRSAKATDNYIASGDENDLTIWQPMFVYHGFRYVQIEGLGGIIDRDDIVAVSLYTDISTNSFFKCGNPLVNQIHKNVVQTEKANMHSILTDCPQRDERMGWMNDATVRFEETPYNFDIGRMFPKLIQDLIDKQSEDGAITCTAPFIYGAQPADPVCSSFLVAGMQSFLHVGNISIINRAYDKYKNWEKCLGERTEDYIVNYSYYGDWAAPSYACDGEDGANSIVTPGIFMSTGYYYFNAILLEKFADILGKNEDKIYYHELAEKIKVAILNKWYNADTAIMCTGSQACQAFSLWLGIIPITDRQKAADIIHAELVNNDYKFTTGNLCTRYLMDVLSQYGYLEDAWIIITKDTYPSFGYMIQNEATTIWERFELKKNPGMNSHNHPMYGAVGYWFYAYLAGIIPTSSGFETVNIKPYMPKHLLSLHASIDSAKGDITVKWIKRYGKTHLYVTVPFGVTAHIQANDNNIDKTVGSGFYHYEW